MQVMATHIPSQLSSGTRQTALLPPDLVNMHHTLLTLALLWEPTLALQATNIIHRSVRSPPTSIWTRVQGIIIISSSSSHLDLGLDSGLDLGLDPGLDLGLDLGLDPGLDLGLDQEQGQGVLKWLMAVKHSFQGCHLLVVAVPSWQGALEWCSLLGREELTGTT